MQNSLFTDPSSNFTHIQNYCVNLFLVKISVHTARKAVLKEQMDAKTPIFEFLHSLRSNPPVSLYKAEFQALIRRIFIELKLWLFLVTNIT